MRRRAGWVCVLTIVGYEELYVGESDGLAAARLDPGTCFGTGGNADEAKRGAWTSAWQFVMRGYNIPVPKPPPPAPDAPLRPDPHDPDELASYIPSRREIARQCRKIRAGWEPGEALRREATLVVTEAPTPADAPTEPAPA